MSDQAAHPLVAALAEAARLLESGQAEDAAGVLRAAIEATSSPPDSAATLEAKRLLERCRGAESALRDKVMDRLRQLGAARRAQSYRGR